MSEHIKSQPESDSPEQMTLADELAHTSDQLRKSATSAETKAGEIDTDIDRADHTGQKIHPERIDEMNRLKDEAEADRRAAEEKRAEAENFDSRS